MVVYRRHQLLSREMIAGYGVRNVSIKPIMFDYTHWVISSVFFNTDLQLLQEFSRERWGTFFNSQFKNKFNFIESNAAFILSWIVKLLVSRDYSNNQLSDNKLLIHCMSESADETINFKTRIWSIVYWFRLLFVSIQAG